MTEPDGQKNCIDDAEHDSDADRVSAYDGTKRSTSKEDAEYGHDDRKMARAEQKGHQEPLTTLPLA